MFYCSKVNTLKFTIRLPNEKYVETRDSNWKHRKERSLNVFGVLDPFAVQPITSGETALSVIVLLFYWHVVSSYSI